MTSLDELHAQLASPDPTDAAAGAVTALGLVMRACRARAQPGTSLFPAFTTAAGAAADALRSLRAAAPPAAAAANAPADLPPEADLADLARKAAARLSAASAQVPEPRAASYRTAAAAAATARDLLDPVRLPSSKP